MAGRVGGLLGKQRYAPHPEFAAGELRPPHEGEVCRRSLNSGDTSGTTSLFSPRYEHGLPRGHDAARVRLRVVPAP